MRISKVKRVILALKLIAWGIAVFFLLFIALDPLPLRSIEIHRVAGRPFAQPFVTFYLNHQQAGAERNSEGAPPIVLLFPGRGSTGRVLRDYARRVGQAGYMAGMVTFSTREYRDEGEEAAHKREDLREAVAVVKKLALGDESRIALLAHSDGATPIFDAALAQGDITAIGVIGKTVDISAMPARIGAIWVGLFDELNDEKGIIELNDFEPHQRWHLSPWSLNQEMTNDIGKEGLRTSLFISPFASHFTESADPLIIGSVIRFLNAAFQRDTLHRPGSSRFFQPHAPLLRRLAALGLIFTLPFLLYRLVAKWSCGCSQIPNYARFLASGGLVFMTALPFSITAAQHPSVVAAFQSNAHTYWRHTPSQTADGSYFLLLMLLVLLAVNTSLRSASTQLQQGDSPPNHGLTARHYLKSVTGLFLLLFLAAGNLLLTDDYFRSNASDFRESAAIFLILHPFLLLSQCVDRVAFFLHSGTAAGNYIVYGLNPAFALSVLAEILSPGCIFHGIAGIRRTLTQSSRVKFLTFQKGQVVALAVLSLAMLGVWSYQLATGAINRDQLQLALETFRRNALLPLIGIVIWVGCYRTRMGGKVDIHSDG